MSRSRRLLVLTSVVAAAVAIGAGGYAVGAQSVGVAGVVAAPTTPPDNARTRAAELVERVLDNPTDTELLESLGDLFYQLGEYGFAAAAMEKVVALDPEHVPARLSLAAGMFNVGRYEEAEAQWRLVLEADPENLEAHYNLGFLYLNQVPPDVARAKEAWGTVLRIAPDSDVGRSIKEQIELLDTVAVPSTPEPSEPAPSAAPARSASP